MYSKRFIKILMICVILCSISSVTLAANKHSSDFQYSYEADWFPSDANNALRWERLIAGGLVNEPYYCSVASGVLTIDTVKGPSETESAYYYIPGQNSLYLQADANQVEIYDNNDVNNPWDVDVEIGYTVEARFKMDGIQIPYDINYPDGRFAFWLETLEGLHGQSNSCQVFPDRIEITSSIPPVTIYNGDLTDEFHTVRIVRNPGAVEDVNEVYDFYLDGALIAESVNGSNTAWNQDSFGFGDAAGLNGGTDIKVEIDYVRFDLTGALSPPYLITDINQDTITDFRDFAALAQNWILYSDPDIAGYIDCTDPNNAAICQ